MRGDECEVAPGEHDCTQGNTILHGGKHVVSITRGLVLPQTWGNKPFTTTHVIDLVRFCFIVGNNDHC